MKCPVCSVDLVMTDRQGVEIDYCPQCRGVWLDRGELDKILDRSMVAPKRDDRDDDDWDEHRKRAESDPYYRNSDAYRRKRRKSFLGELFDFD